MPHPFRFLIWLAAALPAGEAMAQAATSSAEPSQTPEIVVVAQRLRAAVPGAIAPETSLDTGAIDGLGASNLADILAQLGTLTAGSQARAGDGPILLVNGRRIGAFSEVQNLPPEAIARIDILPEEAALRLGYPASSKPVNIVLKQSYAAATLEAEDRVTTWGLRNDFNTELNAVRIAGDNRMTLDAQYQIGDAVTEAKRGVVRPLDVLAASAAGIISNANGGALAPTNAGYLSVPASGRSLADFVAATPGDDTGAWHTLTPATQDLTVNATFARALGGGHTLSAGLRGDLLTAQDLLGPAIASLTIPAGQAGPFTVPVLLNRRIDGAAPLIRASRTATIHAGTQLSGNGRWQWSLAANYDHIGTARHRTGGVDASAWQAAVDAGQVADPFAAPLSGLLAPEAATASSSHDDALALDGLMSGPLGRLPAGQAQITLRGSLGHEVLVADAASSRTELRRDHVGGQASLDLPLLTRRSPIGALDAGVNGAVDRWSDVGGITAYGANLTWKPRKALSLLLALQRDATVPTMQQLGAPPDTSPAVAIYDFGSGQSTTVASVTGGAPGLRPDSRSLAKAELGVKPVSGLTLTTTLTDIVDRNVLFPFAGVTPGAEAALPDHFQRDANGNLIAIDVRPFNAAREHRRELRLAALFTHNFGGGGGPRVPGGGSFGGGHAFGASGSMVQASLTDTIRLTDRLTLATGGPSIDLVGGDALGDALRVPRHRIEAQLSATHNGLGLRANAIWTNGGMAGVGSPGALRFSDHLAVNCRLFWFPAKTLPAAAALPWLHGVRVLLALDNLFDSYQHVTSASGATPLAYQRSILDPLGRTVRLSIRKTFD